MPLATLFDEALSATLEAAFEALPPGIIVAGMPAEPTGWLARLVAALQPDERYYVSVVGADAELRATLPAAVPGDLRFGLGATHAVAVRNAAELPTTARRVVIMLRAEARLHSLRQRNYLSFSSADVVRHLAQQQAETDLPLPQKQFWQCLAQGQPPVALLAFLDFYHAVAGASTAASPRDELYRLGLLPDPSLFDESKHRGVAERLAENADLTQKLLLGDPAHQETAYKQYQAAATVDTRLAGRLLAAFAALRAMDPAAPLPPQLQGLDLPLVRQLLGGQLPTTGSLTNLPNGSANVPIAAEPEPDFTGTSNPDGSGAGADNSGGAADPDEEEDPEPTPATGGRSGAAGGQRSSPSPSPSPKKKYNFGLDDAVVHLATGEVPDLPGGWQATATKLLAKLRTRLDKTPEETKPLEVGRVQVVHSTNVVALALTNGLLGPEQLGGVLTLPHLTTVEEALDALTADQLPPAAPAWDAAWLAELRRYLRTAMVC